MIWIEDSAGDFYRLDLFKHFSVGKCKATNEAGDPVFAVYGKADPFDTRIAIRIGRPVSQQSARGLLKAIIEEIRSHHQREATFTFFDATRFGEGE